MLCREMEYLSGNAAWNLARSGESMVTGTPIWMALGIGSQPCTHLCETLFRELGQSAHTATTSDSKFSSGTGKPSSSRAAMYSWIASLTLAIAASLVSPWLMQPAKLGHSATHPPSSPRMDYHLPHPLILRMARGEVPSDYHAANRHAVGADPRVRPPRTPRRGRHTGPGSRPEA